MNITVNPAKISFTSIFSLFLTKDFFILIERLPNAAESLENLYYGCVDWAIGRFTTISQIVELFSSPVYPSALSV
ncbi:MAG: hypothetical protein AB3A66_06450 [Nodularia sp. CChRGM 3473]